MRMRCNSILVKRPLTTARRIALAVHLLFLLVRPAKRRAVPEGTPQTAPLLGVGHLARPTLSISGQAGPLLVIKMTRLRLSPLALILTSPSRSKRGADCDPAG
jgi:hypothetical protein